MARLSAKSAAKLLGVTPSSLRMLVRQGIVHVKLRGNGSPYYLGSEIEEIKSRRGLTVAQEASQIESEIRQATTLLVRRTGRTLVVFGGLLAGYLLLVAVLTVSFIVSPIKTAGWIGIARTGELAVGSEREEGQVLGETTEIVRKMSMIQGFLAPVGKSSLTIVKNISPAAYAEVAKVAIIDPNDVFGLDMSGGITPVRPIKLAQSSLLQVGSNGLISNLNSEYLQGLKPGTNPGDIAIVNSPAPIATADLEGITIETLGPLSGGGLLPLGGKISLNCPSCLVNLSNTTISAGSGLSGGGVIPLGGSISLAAAGLTVTNFSSPNISQWSNDAGYLSTETDTLASVFGRGNTIPTTSGSSANTIDEATIKVGNIESTATQNFATLNITNGGSGFLDVELLRGFINFQGINTLYDDFTSRTLDTANRWNTMSVGGGSNCGILAGSLGGLLRMHSGGGLNRGCELTTQDITTLTEGYYRRGSNPILETKVRIDTVANARIFAGFTDTRIAATAETNPDSHHAYIAKRAADTTWQCVTDDGGASETIVDTGVTIMAGTFYRLRVELRNGTTPETICTVDDGTTVIRTAVLATQPGANSPMDVYVKLNQSDAVSKNMEVDYVRVWQDDPPAFSLTNVSDLLTMPEADETAEAETMTVWEPQTQTEPEVSVGAQMTIGSVKEIVSATIRELSEFFGNIIFHGDVTFLGRAKFDGDTAGRALIRAGEREVGVSFARTYGDNPIVTASINLEGEGTPDSLPRYEVYNINPDGFTIRLWWPAESDLVFSWIALLVEGENVSTNPEPSATPVPSVDLPPEATPAADAEQTQLLE